MHRVNNLIGFAAGESGIRDLAWRGYSTSSGTASAHTFTNCQLGNPATDRAVIVVGGSNNQGGYTGCTVGGVGLTKVVDVGVGSRSPVIYAGIVPSGTQADVVVSGGSATDWFVGVFTVYGIDPAGFHTATDEVSPLSINLNTPGAGLVIVNVIHNGDPNDTSFSGNITESADVDTGTQQQVVGYAVNVTEQTPMVITHNAVTGSMHMIGASFEAA